jgi:hypothetical protein
MVTPMTPYGFPSELYHCLLDEQPYYLVPQRLLPQYMPGDDYVVNPNCWFSWHGPLPPDKGTRLAFAENLCPSEWMVWVDDPATRNIWPFWVGEQYYWYLSQLVPGFPVPVELPDYVRWVLMCANILVHPSQEAYRRREWFDSVLNGASMFQRGYVSVPGLIHPFHLGALRRYYRYHIRTGAFTLGDGQVSRRYAAHNEHVTRFFHWQLAGIVSDMARTVVRPSYSYFVAYQSGSELARHVDRAQCEYSITLCVDASPEPTDLNPWPIDLETHDGVLRVWQYIGDGLLYRGRYIPHSRERLPDGYTSSSMLLHYVDHNFEGSLS